MKYIVVLGDGMADRPLPEFDGRTVLEAAKKPNMDEMAAQGELVRSGEAVFADILARQVLSLQGITTAGRDISPKAGFTVSGRNMQSFQNKVQLLAQELAGMKARGYTVLLCCSSKTRAKILRGIRCI